uniref:Uncharacterized protein n=1 Tax=Arundo donax TaxID=35708 RepID=A0A0A8YXD1_ARUDO
MVSWAISHLQLHTFLNLKGEAPVLSYKDFDSSPTWKLMVAFGCLHIKSSKSSGFVMTACWKAN